VLAAVEDEKILRDWCVSVARDVTQSFRETERGSIPTQGESAPHLLVSAGSAVESDGRSAKGDNEAPLGLTISLVAGEAVHLEAQHDRSYTAESVIRLLDHLRAALEALVKAPHVRIAELELVSDREGREIESWNATGVTYPSDVVLHGLVETRVRETPDAVALDFGTDHISYDDLNQRANRLAHYLIERGVGPEARVGVFIERSVDLVVALLGIMKSGGAYVPLDPDYPTARLAAMLEDATVSAVITHAHLAERLPKGEAPVVRMDADRSAWSSYPSHNPDHAVTPDNAAYVIFTSGSTGRPKGVVNTHRGICNRLLWMQDTFALTPADRILQKTPFSFDVSVWEFFWPLITGARLVVADPGGHRDPHYLVDLIRRAGITTIHFVPSMLQAFLAAPVEDCASLSRIICSGEALPVDVQNKTLARLSAGLFNLYGPTEAAVDVTWWECRADANGHSVPIGRPVANTQIHILDARGRITPIGVPGELHIGGVQVARGYLNRPDLTAERFVPDPFSSDPGARLYKTGDLAYWREDGAIEFLGRMDHQVKIRGFRIELGEIEARIREHPTVDDCVVTTWSVDGDQRLLAYVVPTANRDVIERESGDTREQWQDIHDSIYTEDRFTDAAFDTVGWDSSYTGQPIPDPEMREWLDGTLGRLKRLSPSRVYEIGCGTGMLLLPLAEACERYWASDFSSKVVTTLQERISRNGYAARDVRVMQREARETNGLPAGEFDTVVLNSVSQYFPSVGYLADVLDQAVGLIGNAGCIFIGDVRNHSLLEAFAISTASFQAERGLTVAHMRQRVDARITRENQLVIDPGFFEVFGASHPRITATEVHLKRGRSHNELTRFRYDVVLHIGERERPQHDATVERWDHHWTVEAIAERLQDGRPDTFRLTGVCNPRLWRETRLLACLREANATAEWQAATASIDADEVTGIEPESFWALEATLPYDVQVTWSTNGDPGTYDVTFRSRSATGSGSATGAGTTRTPDWDQYGNDPRRGAMIRRMGMTLREHLRATLPDYMIPALIIDLVRLPLSPNGKVDRRALPMPDPTAGRAGAADPPRTPTETALAAMWSDAIGLGSISRDDDFFESGGDSILALRIIERARAAGFDLHAPDVFRHPTVAGLARLVDARSHDVEDARHSDAASSTKGRSSHVVRALVARENVEAAFPLSPLQAGMLFHNLYAPESSVYYVQIHGRYTIDLDVAVFRRAWQIVVDRHDVLRAGIVWEGVDQPHHVVYHTVDPHVEVEDLRFLDVETRETRLREIRSHRREGYTLARAPLMDVKLIRVGDREYHLRWNVHHIVLDGWAMLVVLEEVMTAYRAMLAGTPVALPPSISFEHYLTWLQSQNMDACREYWRTTLDGYEPPDTARHPSAPRGGANEESDQHGSVWLRLPPAEFDALKTIARRQRVTLSVLFSAAWGFMIAQRSGRNDVAFGVVVPGRSPDLPGSESGVGMYINSVPARMRFEDGQRVSTLLRNHQLDQAEGRRFGYAPLPTIHQWCGVPAGGALFETLVSVQGVLRTETSPEWARRVMGIEEFGYVDWNTYPLSVEVETGAGLEALIKFDPARWDELAVSDFADGIRAVLRAFVELGDVTVGDVRTALAVHLQSRQQDRKTKVKQSNLEKLRAIRRQSMSPSSRRAGE
jgi:amino acid adenylation domain-containing protein